MRTLLVRGPMHILDSEQTTYTVSDPLVTVLEASRRS